MNNFIAAYSIFKVFTSPVFWFFVALTFVYGQVTQKLTPPAPAPAPNPNICIEGACPNPKKAIARLNQAISKNPKDFQLYESLGSTYCILGQSSQCLANFNKAINLSPDNADIYENLAITIVRIDSAQSAKAFDQAIKIYKQRGDTANVERIQKAKSVFEL